jgi:GR25 family glycosyltransferase involved in LPS biosynthesis
MTDFLFYTKNVSSDKLNIINALKNFGKFVCTDKIMPCKQCFFFDEIELMHMLDKNMISYLYVLKDMRSIHCLQYKNNQKYFNDYNYILLPESQKYQEAYLKMYYKKPIIIVPDIYSSNINLKLLTQKTEPKIAIVLRQKDISEIIVLLERWYSSTNENTKKLHTIWWINSDTSKKEAYNNLSIGSKIRYFIDFSDSELIKQFSALPYNVYTIDDNTTNCSQFYLDWVLNEMKLLTKRSFSFGNVYKQSTFESDFNKLINETNTFNINNALSESMNKTPLHYCDSFLRNVPFTKYIIFVITINEVRQKYIDKQLEALGITVPVVYVQAFTPANSAEFLNDNIGKEKPALKDYYEKIQCCGRSHIQTICKFHKLYKHIPYAIVLEDDVCLIKNDFIKKVNEAVAIYEKNKDIDYLALGYLPDTKNGTRTILSSFDGFQNDSNIYWSLDRKNYNFFGLQAAVYNHKAASLVAELLDKPTAKDIIKSVENWKKQNKYVSDIGVWCGSDTILNIVLRRGTIYPPLAIESPHIPSTIWQPNKEARDTFLWNNVKNEIKLDNYYTE